MDLSDLTIETFRDRVGDTFRDTDAGIAYELRKVEDLTETARHVAEGGRTPFSVTFRGPAEPVVPQGIRPLAHDDLGELEVFLVPVARDADGVSYEAVFT